MGGDKDEPPGSMFDKSKREAQGLSYKQNYEREVANAIEIYVNRIVDAYNDSRGSISITEKDIMSDAKVAFVAYQRLKDPNNRDNHGCLNIMSPHDRETVCMDIMNGIKSIIGKAVRCEIDDEPCYIRCSF